MALSGSFSGNIRSGQFTLRMDWTASQNVTNNTSTVTVKAYLVNTAKLYINSRTGNTIVIDGTTYTYNTGDINTKGTHYLGTASKTLTHNSDGTRTFSMSGVWKIEATLSGTYYGTISASSGTVTLNAIPRTSSFTLSNTSMNMGTKQTVTISRASTAFTHDVIGIFGGLAHRFADNVATSASWTPDVATYAVYIPNTTSGTATITVETYSGSTYIGSTSKTFTLSVPTSVIPVVNSVTLSEAGGVTIGEYVAGRSRVKAVISASGKNGSSIKSITSSASGLSYNGSTITTNTVPASGTNYTFTVASTATDSRGRKGSKSASVTVYARSVTGTLSAFRCNSAGTATDNGTYLRCAINYNVSTINNKNAKSAKVEVRRTDGSTWTSIWTSTTYKYNSSVTIGGGTISTDYSYEVRLSVTDSFGTVTTSTEINTAFELMNFRSTGKGLAVGKVSEADNFDVGIASRFRKNVTVDGNIQTDGHINPAKGMFIPDTRNAVVLPADIPSKSLYTEFKTRSTAGNPPISATGTYSYILNLSGYSSIEGSGGWPIQISMGAEGFSIRQGTGVGTWGAWASTGTAQVLTSTSGGTALCHRYPDGWQTIVWRRTHTTSISNPVGSFYFSSTLARTAWPWPFIEKPHCSVLVEGSGEIIWPSINWGATATLHPEVVLHKGTKNTNSKGYLVEITAHGKWK